jgi:hypothetical protein
MWVESNKMDPGDMEFGGMQKRTLVKAVMNLRVP